jgi:hypothetical protein
LIEVLPNEILGQLDVEHRGNLLNEVLPRIVLFIFSPTHGWCLSHYFVRGLSFGGFVFIIILIIGKLNGSAIFILNLELIAAAIVGLYFRR